MTPFPNGAQAIKRVTHGAQAIKRVTPFSQTQFTVENRISKSPISLFVIAVDIRDFENIPVVFCFLGFFRWRSAIC